ncbi:hypothetical protein AF72_04635 [Xylella taiwanensis]|uniref:Uncharacterized protein n=1 Tax=Xylella taiwanensis TaxID=1444770 RepID=Z9JLJ2_9GAMM|nr:hypothetical protein AB672_01700 [Xylella taiwanensis]EWS78627.1 hypothetical protein AF72_04635 [Xylella taiwanensis]
MLHDPLRRGYPELPRRCSAPAILALSQRRAAMTGTPRSSAVAQRHQRTGPGMHCGIPDTALRKHRQAGGVPRLVCIAYRSHVAIDTEEPDVNAQQAVHIKTKT